LQVLNDVDGFGGFISSFLTAFRDDYSKTATLAFGILSGNNVEDLDNLDFNNVCGLQCPSECLNANSTWMFQTKVVQGTMTDALYLRSLKELGGLTVPLQPPTSWSEGCWKGVNLQPVRDLVVLFELALRQKSPKGVEAKSLLLFGTPVQLH
jgi:hypothetical protein